MYFRNSSFSIQVAIRGNFRQKAIIAFCVPYLIIYLVIYYRRFPSNGAHYSATLENHDIFTFQYVIGLFAEYPSCYVHVHLPSRLLFPRTTLCYCQSTYPPASVHHGVRRPTPLPCGTSSSIEINYTMVGQNSSTSTRTRY